MLAVRRTFVVLGALLAVAIVGGAVVAFLVFGVQPSASPTGRAPAASVVADSMDSPAAPAAFRDRPPFRSCGQLEVERGGGVPADRIACLATTPGEGRELIVVTSTAEGAPVVRYYRTGPGITGVEIFEDATDDRVGGAWRRLDCRSGQIDQFGACA
ncbi:hypothetical protein [Amnibacterium kyonggiense]|uniref:Uncharacterized protein n=1 Tax=Amnibacterium kyonggiense TaxID=595671 RepID=A0A4R7FM31_9MICO|nr:hypothetical protein [Amnibacterium kyonggiense]TDS77490.1 hypothetical protein CLV52_2436 [Amnibacterium kyonggiense]